MSDDALAVPGESPKSDSAPTEDPEVVVGSSILQEATDALLLLGKR